MYFSFLNLPPVFLRGTSKNALQYAIHKGGGGTSGPAKIAELNAGQMTKKVTERKKERQESVSDFLKPNVLVLSRKESENKGDIPPSLMALFSNFFYPILLLLQLNLAYMKRILHLVPVKNIFSKSSINPNGTQDPSPFYG